MNKTLRTLLLAAGISVSAAIGGAVATSVFHSTNPAFAGAQAQVTLARQNLDATNGVSGDLSAVFKNVNRAVEPSVVQIQTRTAVTSGPGNMRQFFQFGPEVPEGAFPQLPDADNNAFSLGNGSGVVMVVNGSEGFILTNNHVVAGANSLSVTLSDGRVITDATVVGTDPRTDLAVVKIKAEGLIAAKWGDSAALEKGDWVMAFGSPFGLGGSMTHGIVSALNRNVGILGNMGFEDFIQTDAPINPGNSGGPLVNTRGEVIGINQSIISRSGSFSGLGFAVPSKLAQPVFESLKNDGKISRGYLGVGIADANSTDEDIKALVQSTGYSGDGGALVQQTVRGGPSAGKIRAGDIVTAVDGKAVKTSKELRETIAGIKPGTAVKLSIFRDGKSAEETVTLGEQPTEVTALAPGQRRAPAPGARSPEQVQGLELRSLTESLAKQHGLDNAETGAVVTNVQMGSLAFRAGLRTGDLITSINGVEVNSAEEAAKAMKAADFSKGVRLNVTNRDGSRFVLIRER